ncbi:MAG TPA: helix-turn-helix domain-containing protein, partial [Pirellulaceae bacterium]|nr:helix-turn-helix domain-containing protein [Pirellulaceae bacterium]
IAGGTFRSDLYHRLKVVTISLPKLSERLQDIPLLIEHFIRQFARRHHKQIKSMTPAARVKLMGYPWPGNVRELRNTIESMIVVDFDGVLDLDDLPPEFIGQPVVEAVGGGQPATGGISSLIGQPLEAIEKICITETLKFTGGNREQAAEMLGIGERTLYRKIKEYGL